MSEEEESVSAGEHDGQLVQPAATGVEKDIELFSLLLFLLHRCLQSFHGPLALPQIFLLCVEELNGVYVMILLRFHRHRGDGEENARETTGAEKRREEERREEEKRREEKREDEKR